VVSSELARDQVPDAQQQAQRRHLEGRDQQALLQQVAPRHDDARQVSPSCRRPSIWPAS
jgi:hypothetical protein